MSVTPPLQTPDSFRQGVTVNWRISAPDYLPGDGWVLTYLFARVDDHQDADSTDYGDGTHLMTISATDSASFIVGIYTYSAQVALGEEVIELFSGQVEVLPALDDDADARSLTKQTLDAITAALLTRAPHALTISYSISTGGMSRSATISVAEALEWQKRLRRDYYREVARERAKAGRPSRRRIGVRFV